MESKDSRGGEGLYQVNAIMLDAYVRRAILTVHQFFDSIPHTFDYFISKCFVTILICKSRVCVDLQ